MADGFAIEVEGLRELKAALRKVESKLPREVGQAGKKAADYLTPMIRAKVLVRSGAAQRSVRAVVSQGGGGIRAGGAKAPYWAWLNWGGSVGRNRSVYRPKVRPDRYVYATFADKRDEVLDRYLDAMRDLLRSAGLED